MAPQVDGTKRSELATAFDVLSSPARLAILGQLRSPKTVTEIEVRVCPKRGGDRDRTRLLARQTVKEHLDKLVERSLVTTRRHPTGDDQPGPGGPSTRRTIPADGVARHGRGPPAARGALWTVQRGSSTT